MDGQGRPERVAAGGADFGLTAVAYLLQDLAATGGDLAVRFVGGLHRSHPIAALVDAASDVDDPADLAGLRTADWALRFMTPAYAAALEDRGLAPPVFVELDGGTDPSDAVRDGYVEAIPTWADTIPVRTRNGVALKAVPLGWDDVCASGLVAADHVPDEIAGRMRDAVAAGLERQREAPDTAIAGFAERYDLPRPYAAQGWALFEPYTAHSTAALTMTSDQWASSAAHTAAVHGLPPQDPDRVHRPELAGQSASRV